MTGTFYTTISGNCEFELHNGTRLTVDSNGDFLVLDPGKDSYYTAGDIIFAHDSDSPLKTRRFLCDYLLSSKIAVGSSGGKITPEAIKEFCKGCRHYFVQVGGGNCWKANYEKRDENGRA